MDRSAILTQFLADIWSAGRVDKVSDYIAPRYTVHHDPGDPWDGKTLTRDGFCDRLVTSRAAAPDQVFVPRRMIAQADTVVVLWDGSGTHLGDLPGLPTTGRSITMSGMTMYDFDGVFLTGHWQIADRLSVWQQLAAWGQTIKTVLFPPFGGQSPNTPH